MRDVPIDPDRHSGCGPSLAGERASFRLFTEGDDLYEAMISAIGTARRSIRLESFIFAADEIGWQFATALSAKARAGVDVRFHFDARGALTGFLPDLFREMADAGVALKWYRPWSWRHPRRYFQRNHRKLLIVDGEELFLGGFNVQLENSRRLYGDGRTRDTHVRVRGELARQAAVLFDRTWDDPAKSYADATAPAPPDSSCLHWQHFGNLYAGLIGRSARHVYITTPYFCPGSIVERAARQAARRMVDVRLLVPRQSDPPFVGWLTRSGYARLMADGVRIYEYHPARKLHAKTALIDDEWCVVGSPNLDHLSLFVNHELALVARDRGLADALRSQYFVDLDNASEVQPSAWANRAWTERGVEAIGWAARRLL